MVFRNGAIFPSSATRFPEDEGFQIVAVNLRRGAGDGQPEDEREFFVDDLLAPIDEEDLDLDGESADDWETTDAGESDDEGFSMDED